MNGAIHQQFSEPSGESRQALPALELHDRDGEFLRCDLWVALADAQRRAGIPTQRETVARAVEIARQFG